MPRTVEHILTCHQLADQLRKAGKPAWRATFDFKGVFPDGLERVPDDPTSAQCIELGCKYAAFIRNHPFVTQGHLLDFMNEGYDEELDLIVENLECISANPEEAEDELDDLNDHIEALYDWADLNRVWVTGLRG